MNRFLYTTLFVVGAIALLTCDRNNNAYDASAVTSFFGDSICTLVARSKENGYKTKILYSNEGPIMMKFERGDSLVQIICLNDLPLGLGKYKDSVGVFVIDMNFPVAKSDTLGEGIRNNMFFQDVNFDGEEEFLVRHPGYNRDYYAAFDLAKGGYYSSCPGILECESNPPYNNLVSGNSSFTVLDYGNKSIYIEEQMGCCARQYTWAKDTEDKWGDSKGIRITRQEYIVSTPEGQNIEVYLLIDDTLRKVKDVLIPWEHL